MHRSVFHWSIAKLLLLLQLICSVVQMPAYSPCLILLYLNIPCYDTPIVMTCAPLLCPLPSSSRTVERTVPFVYLCSQIGIFHNTIYFSKIFTKSHPNLFHCSFSSLRNWQGKLGYRGAVEKTLQMQTMMQCNIFYSHIYVCGNKQTKNDISRLPCRVCDVGISVI